MKWAKKILYVWTTTLPLLHFLQLLKMMAMMAIFLEMNSKGLVLSLKKREKRKFGSAVHFPYKT